MKNKIYLCSHLYCAYDPILAAGFLHGKNIIKKGENVLVVTAIESIADCYFNLDGVSYEGVCTSEKNDNATKKIKEKIREGYSICIFYPEFKIKPGILRILKSSEFSNYNFEIYTVNIKVNNSLPIDMKDNKSFIGLSKIILSNIKLLLKFTNNTIKSDIWHLDIKNIKEENFLRILRSKIT